MGKDAVTKEVLGRVEHVGGVGELLLFGYLYVHFNYNLYMFNRMVSPISTYFMMKANMIKELFERKRMLNDFKFKKETIISYM